MSTATFSIHGSSDSKYRTNSCVGLPHVHLETSDAASSALFGFQAGLIGANTIKDCDPQAFGEWIWSDVDDQAKGLGQAFCREHHLRLTIRNDLSSLEEHQAIQNRLAN